MWERRTSSLWATASRARGVPRRGARRGASGCTYVPGERALVAAIFLHCIVLSGVGPLVAARAPRVAWGHCAGCRDRPRPTKPIELSAPCSLTIRLSAEATAHYCSRGTL